MSDIYKAVIAAVVGFVLLEAHRAQQEGRKFSFSNVPVVGQIMAPTLDQLPNTTGTQSYAQPITMEQALMAIDADPALVADLTPQGQYRIDPRMSG